MRLTCHFLGAAGLACLWTSAAAAAVDLSGEIGVVSDYRYRGISLSRGRPAVQGTLTLAHDSGLYAEVWASTLERPGDPTSSEVDFTAGYEKDLSEHFSIDLSGTSFAYPSAGADNYFEATAIVTTTRGRASASAGVSYIPRQRATRDEQGRGHDNSYLFGTAEYGLPRTPVTLKAGLGYERGAFDEVEHGGKWDWTLGGEVKLKPAKLGLAYVGSNAGAGDRHALVATLSFAW
ncbi:MAG: hypothetical protein QOD54_672 [Sphingomonadales bacterium]|nr:hypothetical protein [Sphingomonadales bacterium]